VDAPEAAPFHDLFVALFDVHFPRLYRYLDRLSGEPDLAADVAQEAFVRLYHRGAMPDSPQAWLISVAMNVFRDVKLRWRRNPGCGCEGRSTSFPSGSGASCSSGRRATATVTWQPR
jgi:DNA-directed RNA polymerase specialized sigma24 family protein